MDEKIPKEHTRAYLLMKAEAEELTRIVNSVRLAPGRCADDLCKAVRKECMRRWDAFIVDLLIQSDKTECTPDDIRAAWVRLKDGKHLLTFLDEEVVNVARAA